MDNTLSTQINDFNNFQDSCNYFDIELKNNQLDLFKKYYEILLDWNKKINLISRKEQNILEKHFLDSILFLPEIEGIARKGVEHSAPTDGFDIGSGGGFPAIPLVIMRPEWKFTLCESTSKKANFLISLVKELELETRIIIVNNRVEAVHKLSSHKNKYNFVTARAITKLDELIKYSMPLLKKDGCLLAYKGKSVGDEMKIAEKKYKLPIKIFRKEISGIERNLVMVQKIT